MKAAWQTMQRFFRDEHGPTATEYAVLIAVICISVISAMSAFGQHMENLYLALANGV